ncbi:MAG: alpha-L-rhamnosidase C-terminal domain-containing protein, partial [Armatimonadota bacterium]
RPTFFLSTYVLGVRPDKPGFSVTVIEPHPADLTWCRGRMPAPMGDIEVQWENHAHKPFIIRVIAPEETEIRVRMPRAGTATLNGRIIPTEPSTDHFVEEIRVF